MRNKSFYLIVAVALLLGSCKSSGSDSAIATDMCGCFNMLKDSLPPAAMVVFEKAAVAENPKEAFGKEIQKLDPEAAQKVTAALMATAKTGSPINDCLKKLDEKYKSPSNNEQEVAKKMIEALKDKKGCDIMLALMRMNLKK